MKEWISLFTSSFLIGFTAAATLGPIAVLCIQRTLRHGWRVGAVSGVGVALADAFYGLAGALGFSVLTQLLTGYQSMVRLVGGGILIFIGIRSIISKVDFSGGDRNWEEVTGGQLSSLLSIFFLTLSNPMTILFFSAVYAGLGVDGGVVQSSAGRVLLFALGVFSGSLSWWLILASLVTGLRQQFQLVQLVWLHRVSGLVITGFGVWIVFQVGVI